MKTTILLIRHGESAANRTRTFAGHLDIPLSERGEEQANATAEYITSKYQIDKIYCSDLSRAYATALPIARLCGLEVEKTEKFREIYAGSWEGKTFDELQTRYASSYGVWLTDIGSAQPDGGEAVHALYERVFEALDEIVKVNEGKMVAIATHATPIRSLCCRFHGFDVSEMKNVAWVSNASVTEIVYEGGKYTLTSVDQNEHLASLATRFPANV